MPLLAFGEYRPDVSDYEGQHTRNILNVLPRGDGYGPMRDVMSLTQALPSSCKGAFTARKNDGSVVVFAATTTKLYRLSNTDYSWVDASLGAGTYTTLNDVDQWQFAQFGNFVIAVQANAVPQVYDITGAGPFANLAGSPPQARYVANVGRFLVLSGLNSNPYRIHWSGLNDVTNWTSGVNFSDFQDFPDGGFVRTVAGGEFGVIFQDSAIRRMTFVPGSTAAFQIERIAQDDGIYAPLSLAKAGEKLFFCSPQGFKVISGTGVPTQIGRERIDRTALADIDISQPQFFVGVADPASSRIFWSYKSVNNGNTNFDKGLCYDWAIDRWTPISWTGEFLCTLVQPGVTLENLDSVSSSIDALTLSLDSYSTAVVPQLALFNGHTGQIFSGTAKEATLETSEHGAAPNRIRVRGFRPITDASGYYGRLSYRDTESSAVSLTNEIAVNANANIDVNVAARYARGRIRIPAGTTWTFAVGVEPDVSTEGLR